MKPMPNDPSLAGVPAKESRRQVSFVLHEVADYIVAAALIAVGIHVSGSAQMLLVAVGVAVIVLGALSVGKLGAFSVLSRRAHHWGDLAIIAVLVLSPIPLHRQLHVTGSVLAVVIALVLLRIERGTIYQDTPPRSARAARSMPTGVGESVGTAAAIASATAAQLAPVAGKAAKVGVRSLGIMAGATRRAIREQGSSRSSQTKS